MHRLLTKYLQESTDPLRQDVTTLQNVVDTSRSEPVAMRIDEALNSSLSELTGVSDYLQTAATHRGMRNESLRLGLVQVQQDVAQGQQALQEHKALPGPQVLEVAGVFITGGTLVARTSEGVVPYSTADLTHRYCLLGFALNSALAGDIVQVQLSGPITYPGLGLEAGKTLLAGADGRLVYSSEGLLLHHVVGLAQTADSLLFSSTFPSYQR